MLESRFNEIAETVSRASYSVITGNLRNWYYDFFKDSEFQLYEAALISHIRFFVPNGWNSKISDYAFPELTQPEFTWIYFDGDISETNIPWYKKDAIKDFQNKLISQEEYFMNRSLYSFCGYSYGSIPWIVLRKLVREGKYVVAGNDLFQKIV